MLEEMLCDKLVCGINNGAIQRRLLAESDLTLTKAIAVAQAAGVADSEVKEIQSSIAGASIVSTTDNKDVHKCTSEYPARTKTMLTGTQIVIVVVLNIFLINVVSSR